MMRALTFLFVIMKNLFIDTESIPEQTINFSWRTIFQKGVLKSFYTYNQFNKQVLNMSLTSKQKINITTEFKSTLLDRTYP